MANTNGPQCINGIRKYLANKDISEYLNKPIFSITKMNNEQTQTNNNNNNNNQKQEQEANVTNTSPSHAPVTSIQTTPNVSSDLKDEPQSRQIRSSIDVPTLSNVPSRASLSDLAPNTPPQVVTPTIHSNEANEKEPLRRIVNSDSNYSLRTEPNSANSVNLNLQTPPSSKSELLFIVHFGY